MKKLLILPLLLLTINIFGASFHFDGRKFIGYTEKEKSIIMNYIIEEGELLKEAAYHIATGKDFYKYVEDHNYKLYTDDLVEQKAIAKFEKEYLSFYKNKDTNTYYFKDSNGKMSMLKTDMRRDFGISTTEDKKIEYKELYFTSKKEIQQLNESLDNIFKKEDFEKQKLGLKKEIEKINKNISSVLEILSEPFKEEDSGIHTPEVKLDKNMEYYFSINNEPNELDYGIYIHFDKKKKIFSYTYGFIKKSSTSENITITENKKKELITGVLNYLGNGVFLSLQKGNESTKESANPGNINTDYFLVFTVIAIYKDSYEININKINSLIDKLEESQKILDTYKVSLQNIDNRKIYNIYSNCLITLKKSLNQLKLLKI